MAALGTLVPTALDSQTGDTWTTTTVGNIDNTVAAPSGTFIVSATNSDASIWYAFTDTPSGFLDGEILTLNYNIRYKIDSLSGDTETLFIRVWSAAGGTAYTNEETVAALTATQAIGNKGSTAMTITSAGLAATKAEWDAAVIEIRTVHNQSGGPDGSIWSIDEVELTGTYDTPPTVALNTPADSATGVSITPDLLFTGTDTESDEIEYKVEISDSSDITIDHYSKINGTSGEVMYSGATEGVSQSLTGNGDTLTSVRFFMRKLNAPTGNAVAKIYAHSGTFGTSSVPTGAALSTSDNFDVSTLTDSVYTIAVVSFSGVEQITLTNATKYVLTIEYSGGDATDRIQARYDNSGEHGGNLATYNGTSWTANSGRDLVFYVLSGYFVEKLSVTPDATFAGTGDPHPWPSGNQITYTVQSGDTLTNSTVYYWRVAGTDPLGTDAYGAWSSTRSFTTVSAVAATIKTWNGVAIASVKTRNGVAAASIKTANTADK